ncbi:hypothetical protein [Candidatus Nephthysia bennettiae]|uniref:Uncharacterized protein n=1 Tax=Candidatus Nephthysia bennettiae TaxID=3127016 RepID=A0A934K753_9BACT|nr:hypothetical protein [Candidatus Dormibacteraeota bacterium]MBJ7612965.1 hypothetical protein [Candidatus Dormibacteraeota bacterium]
MTDDSMEAARRSLDPERLLPGEDLASNDPADVARWVTIYRELKETKQTLADDLAAALETASQAARAELESVDMVLISVQLDRFERRFTYWSDRERELSTMAGREK